MVFRILTLILAMFVLLGLYKWKNYEELKNSSADRVVLPEEFNKAETKVTSKAMIKFVVEEEYSPPLPQREPQPEKARMIFSKDDYNEQERSFKKPVKDIQGNLDQIAMDFSNEDYSSLMVVVIDSERAGWAYYGQLVFDSGEPDTDPEILDKNHRAWVVASPEEQP